VESAFRLPAHAGHPASAWPPDAEALLPGPLVYWPCTAIVGLAVVAVVVVAHRLFSGPGPGTERRHRLGVDTRARLARPRDLAPLVVPGPRPGRLIVGRVEGRLVATENRAMGKARARRARRGDRSAVCVIGPTRCGKTANVISGILDWEGPAILSSVKDDLLEATLRRRSEVGEVKVFDPTGVTDATSSRWSPLRDAATPTGAAKAARSLMAAHSRPGGREDVEFFGDLGTAFLASFFYLAASSGRTMADVVRWVLKRDRPSATTTGEVAGLVDLQLASDDPQRREWAGLALFQRGRSRRPRLVRGHVDPHLLRAGQRHLVAQEQHCPGHRDPEVGWERRLFRLDRLRVPRNRLIASFGTMNDRQSDQA
jgi:type IV secretion system protein VirD4